MQHTNPKLIYFMKHNNHHYKNQKYCFWHFFTDTIPFRFYRGDWKVKEIWRELHSAELETNVKQKKNIKQQQDIISQSNVSCQSFDLLKCFLMLWFIKFIGHLFLEAA